MEISLLPQEKREKLLSSTQMVFFHGSWSTNGLADVLAKHGFDKACHLEASLI